MLESKAKDLGRTIGQSDEYKAVKRSSEALNADTLLQQVQVNSAYQAAISAQDNFDKLMLRVNQWIAEGIRTGATSSIILG